MDKGRKKSVLVPMVSVLLGGPVLLIAVFFGYLVLYTFVESVIIGNPLLVPAQKVRITYLLILLIMFFFVYRSRVKEIIKAIAMIAPLSMALVTLILGFYENLNVVYLGLCMLIIGLLILIYYGKKPWYYYFAVAITVGFAIFYAWP